LTNRGYQLVSFENVLGRSLDGLTDSAMSPGVEVRLSDDPTAWLDVVVDGFGHPDEEGVPSHEDFPPAGLVNAIADIEKAGATPYLAFREGVVAGAASMRTSEGVAQLTGAATAPVHRRRGVQTAMLATRLTDAVRTGCDIAVVTTQPGSKSQQNVQRRGFHLLYTRAVLAKG
jgi:GNAT superfamily N-acetyltransferase